MPKVSNIWDEDAFEQDTGFDCLWTNQSWAVCEKLLGTLVTDFDMRNVFLEKNSLKVDVIFFNALTTEINES